MGRAGVALTVWLLGAACLAACGDATPQTALPLEAEAQSRQAPVRVPSLRGRAAPTAPPGLADPSGATPEPKATVDAKARISIPADATWATLKAALRESADLRRARERLAYSASVLVSLPGDEGYVTVGRRPTRRDVGLELTLAGSVREPSMRVDAVGTAWIARNGCEAERRWEADTWSLGLWETALRGLGELDRSAGKGLRVQADGDVPAERVIAFLVAAADAGFDAPFVETSRRRRFCDAVDDTLRWLAAHQLPSGGWNDELALCYCDGLRMQGVPIPDGPQAIEDAGLTGLALCAFLGAGYTNRGKHPFARVVSRGLRHLKRLQDPDGVFRSGEDGPAAVGHGWATLAMVQAYEMTGSPLFKGAAQRSLDVLGPTWRRSAENPLATVLAAMGLRIAQLINQDRVKRGRLPTLTLDGRFQRELHADALSYGESGAGLRIAAGLLTRILLGDKPDEHAEIGDGAARLVASLCASGEGADPCLTWLTSLVAYQVGGTQAWVPMRKALAASSLGSARKGGHPCCLKGSLDPRPDPSVAGGRVAATALLALRLQLFYRYDSVLHRR